MLTLKGRPAGVHVILREPTIKIWLFLCRQILENHYDMGLPDEIAKAWRQCGIKVRGVWSVDSKDQTLHFSHKDHWQLIAVKSGSFSLSTATANTHCRENSLALFAPGAAASGTCTPGAQLINALISAIPAPNTRIPWSMVNMPLVVSDMGYQRLELLLAGMDGINWRDMDWAMRARFTCDRLLWNMLAKGYADGSIQSQGSRPAWLRDAIAATLKSIKNPDFGVPEFVRLAGCSHAHLCRTLQASDQSTPGEFLRKLRVEMAAHIMHHDAEVSSDEIAQRCGFTSARQFRRHWQEETNKPLRGFRRKTKG